MKILNLSIEIVKTSENIKSIYSSGRPDFILKLSELSEVAN
jgi:hypothetical protein